MAKKFYDILPKKRQEKVEIKIEKEKGLKEKRAKKNWIFYFFVFVLGAGFFLVNFYFASCEIFLSPKVDEQKIEEGWKLNPNLENIDEKEKVLPVKIFEKEILVSENVVATGEKEKKAEGKIILYNAFATWPETWAKGTRFLSSEGGGKIFVSKEKIQVPPAKIDEKGKIIPSSVEVEVEAADFGPEYNIGPSKFSIPSFKGTGKYLKYWAESSEAMKKGGKVKVVKKEDIENGKERLKKKAIEVARQTSQKENPNFYFFENLGEAEIKNIEGEKGLEGKETETFELKGTLNVKLVGISKETLQGIFKQKFQEKFSKDYDLKSQDLKVASASFDFSKGQGEATILFLFELKRKLDLDEIKKSVILLKVDEAQEYLAHHPNISNAKIKVFPRWIKKIPKKCSIILSE